MNVEADINRIKLLYTRVQVYSLRVSPDSNLKIIRAPHVPKTAEFILHFTHNHNLCIYDSFIQFIFDSYFSYIKYYKYFNI